MLLNRVVFEELKKSCGSVFSLCKTPLGNDVWCAALGRGSRVAIVTGGIHARERHTYKIVTEMAKSFQPKPDQCAYFIPLVNPDGAAFCEGETVYVESEFLAGRFTKNRALFKANINCVDLNTNFPARWGTGKHNQTTPNYENYIGTRPLCEIESRALCDFTLAVRPITTLSYHSMGRQVYWQFNQDSEFALTRDKQFARAVSEKIHCACIDGTLDSAGGYKDFCISSLKIPALTIEAVSCGKHPLKLSDYNRDIRLNRRLLPFVYDTLNALDYY